jgi:hypothetical protein
VLPLYPAPWTRSIRVPGLLEELKLPYEREKRECSSADIMLSFPGRCAGHEALGPGLVRYGGRLEQPPALRVATSAESSPNGLPLCLGGGGAELLAGPGHDAVVTRL